LSRATSLADLYRASVQEYTRTSAEWKGLLSCVARFYKRSFDNAVLIYAQKPDATQMGTFDEWHDKRVGRSINRGAKSIAVIDMVNPNASIKYLFDFMDTNGSVQSYRNLQKYLWELEEQYRPSVIMRFHEKYNTPTRSMDACLYHLVSRRVRDWLLPYMENFRVRDEESPLHGMPEDAVKAEFMGLVMESVAYTVFSKCGISTEMFADDSFENICNYNTLQLFMALGSCTVSIARPILNEIYREIQDIKIERSKIYENRAIDELHIQTGRGRDDVSRNQSIGESADRPDAGGTVREPVEIVHDGEASPQAVGAGGTGQGKRGDPAGRPGGRAEERGADPGTAGLPPHAGDGGHHGESRTHEHDNERGGRDRDGRGGAESQITPASPSSPQTIKSPADGSKPSVGDFFVVPPRAKQETMQASRSDAEEIPAQKSEPITQPGQGTGFARSQKETAEPEQKSKENRQTQAASETEKDIIQEMPEKPEIAESGNHEISGEIKAETPSCSSGLLEEEEISELLDTVLCADDLVPDARVWHSEICGFFQRGNSQEKKANALKLIYGELDEDYTIREGSYQVHVLGQSEGIVFQADGGDYFYPYLELSKRIDALILGGIYPFSIEEERLDDFVIPDEREELEESRRNSGSGSITGNAEGQENSYDQKQPGTWKKVAVGQEQSEAGQENTGRQKPVVGDGQAQEEVPMLGEALMAEEAPDRQLSLFDMGMEAGYEDNTDSGQDALLDTDKVPEQPRPFQEGERISYNGRVYEVLQYLYDNRTVEIGDIGQLKNLNGFKIRERVPVTEIEGCQAVKDNYTDGEIASMVEMAVQGDEATAEQKEALQAAVQTVQANEAHDSAILEDFDRRGLHGLNYHYSEEHHLYDGGPKTKFQNNVAAIRLLKELEEQGRKATAEEQVILAKYVGWGGLANALTPGKSGWESQYEEIRQLLTEEEFQAAQESTLTAYYTEQGVIRHIYDALEKFGFHGGNILDPAMATGNFFSVLPESMADSRLYGVEIEPISGHIAKHLYPGADIQITGFEHTSHPDQFFDVVIGNIPFNSIKVDDPRYNRYNFRIHDYFLAKSLDKTRPGGIVAVITSKYTMDKANSGNRRYLAQRAELLGAIRLPNIAFRQVAGTEATTDILFLKKREREIVPDEANSPWLSVEQNGDGIPMNTWFIDHPEMVLGKMVFDESMYGNEKSTACHPMPGDDLDERLERAVSYLEGTYEEPKQEGDIPQAESAPEIKSIPADPAVRNFSYALADGKLYYREHSRMYEQDITGRKAERIKGLVEITQTVRRLIDFQNQEQESRPAAEYEAALQEHIKNLNRVYDRFVKEYGYINAYANVTAFSRDANAPLLRSIEREKKDETRENGQKDIRYEKTAIFYKATIRPKAMPAVVESAEEALKVSLNVKGRLDLDYMAQLYRKPDGGRATKDEIIEELGEQIYQDPVLYAGNPYAGWQTAGEYLSGYVKDKLAEAVIKAEEEPERFSRNVEALRTVQPTPLTPQEISFSLGTPWIPLETYQDFMYEVFKTQEGSRYGRYATELEFSRYSGVYFIANKGNESGSVTACQVYGTERMNAYEILEASLNLRFVEVKDRVEYTDPDTGEEKVKYVLNKKETILAREKQAQIKAEFERWLFAEPERAARLTKLYNDRFNNIRPRTYDGSDLVLPDLSEDIRLRPHQLDVIAHGLYGDGNLLMAHEVGAGKTYAAIVLAHELKRLGKVTKPLIAVPNHLVGQWSDAYMELYPNANILVAEKKDFQKQNRRRFVSRIATGEYDCIIMAHSSFELIGLSRERQLAAMETELNEVTRAIDEQKARDGKNWSLKQMQIFRKNLQFRYDQLFKAEKKDDVINFEELGVDALIVDEAHAYKNNFSYTKMRNVAGISGQSSQRAMDMHQKCQYINEISGGKGVIYLTGTPVSNSMSELYVMQKTLQPKELERRGLLMFDAWAGTFGRVTSSLEIRPEGNGYQMKNRFSQFHNLPELMSMFSMIADIRTADMLELPTPELKTGSPQVIKSVCTPDQKRIVMELAERAEAIRNGEVDSTQDNFLKLTHEARLLSIDPRAIDPEIPDDPGTKLNLCADKVAEIYQETVADRLTQLIFCDQGTPKYDGSFNFYEAAKTALIAQGVKPEEINFIHDAKTDVQREQLFEKVRKGEIRILMGSTEKMGTGMNVQEKLIALHHLDVPWRPADLTQRNGRILRQGNENKEVSIFNYITENTFDSYLWQILEQKQRYISQIMTGRSPLRTCEDLDETVLQYAEFKALATSDPRVKEKMETDNEINRLTVLKSSWQSQQAQLQGQASRHYPVRIARKENEIAVRDEDIRTYQANKTEDFRIVIDGRIHDERTKAAEHLMVCGRRVMKMEVGSFLDVGSYAGLTIRLTKPDMGGMKIRLCGKGSYSTDYGDSELGNITRIEHLADRIVSDDKYDREELASLKQQLVAAKEQCGKPFPDEERLLELQKKKVQLDLALEFKEDGEDVMAAEENGEGSGQGDRKEPPTLEQRIYRKLRLFAAPILDGEACYMKLQAKGYEDLVVEAIGGEEYSIAHYYDQNGDSMRDPEITFTIDQENKSIHPASFLQDGIGVYYETEDAAPAMVKDLKEFMVQWFTNIKNQKFEPVKIKRYEQEEENGMER
jgi:N12 class adenine-specific DNA methylase